MTWWPPDAGGLGVLAIGETVQLGAPNAVLFVGPTGLLAQDPGRFDYEVASHTLYFDLSTTPVLGVRAADVTYGVPLSLTAQDFDLGSGVTDPVMRLGWNIAVGGGLAVAGKAGISTEMEGAAQRNADPTRRQVEWHAVGLDTSGALYRALTWHLYDDGSYLEVGSRADYWLWTDRAANASVAALDAAVKRLILLQPGAAFWAQDKDAVNRFVAGFDATVTNQLNISDASGAIVTLADLKVVGNTVLQANASNPVTVLNPANLGEVLVVKGDGSVKDLTLLGVASKAPTGANFSWQINGNERMSLDASAWVCNDGAYLRGGVMETLVLTAVGPTTAALKVVATTDVPTGASATYLKVDVGGTPFYIALKAAS